MPLQLSTVALAQTQMLSVSGAKFLSQTVIYVVGALLIIAGLCYIFKRSWYYRLCKAVENFTQDRRIKPVAAVVTVAVGGYFTVKKAFAWSLSETLDSVFHTHAATFVSFVLLLIVVFAVAINALNIWFESNPIEPVKKIEPEGISRCILKINNEIQQHCDKLQNEQASLIRTRLLDGHSFKENVALVTESLVDHAVSSLKGFKARRRDIFVSVYKVPNFQDLSAPRTELQYITHYPTNRDSVGTKAIVLADPTKQGFACVRCLNSSHEYISSLDCADYAPGSGKRTKTLKHYYGFAVKADAQLLGFINIELHNEQFFQDRDQLDDYAENHLIVFKYLIAHQFLKAAFLHQLEKHLPK